MRAQGAAHDVLERRAGARSRDELAPFLAKVDAAIGGFDGKRVVEIGSDHAGVTLRLVADLYSHFGPIWSTAYGHLWLEHDGRLLTYHDVLLSTTTSDAWRKAPSRPCS